ncbi:ATP-binding protein [Candidatus Albibeggiatoa sp. nov. NOAA]|uniref:ATP-binding protein n=1 Tax=Candidatus Albibeggiatoa sp. nov. NOAA TaxID=3162724 RepID=UPI0032FF070C|nr:ATP-binding protein [Thiotrichaceae bacterium]
MDDTFQSTMGVSLLCDNHGKIISLLCDELNLSSILKVGQLFTAAFDTENMEKAGNFLLELKTKGVTFDWPLPLYVDDKLLLLHFTGGLNGENLFIIGNTTPTSINQFFDELMKINNEQANVLRETMKAQMQIKQQAEVDQDTHLYEELSQLNNELANTQRELTKKNVQLEQQRKELKKLNTELSDTVEELSQTRHELVQSEKMASLGRLVSGFAHELNTPIGIAVGSASALQKEAKKIVAMLDEDEVDVDELVSAVNSVNQGFDLTLSNLERAGNLVSSFKRTAVDQTSGEKRYFDVHEVIQDTINTLNNRFKKTDIQIQLDCPVDLKVVSLPGALEQILTNLLINSLIHGFDEGQQTGDIHISVQLEDEVLSLQYQDNGNGIAPENIEKIFEPFFTTHRSHGGSGLGGYICYNLVTNQLKGTISCDSQVGQGVTFNMSYPIELSMTSQE